MSVKNKTIEEKLENLEALVSELESDELTIEESLKKFEKGVTLFKDCKSALNTVEKKVKKLTDTLKEEDI